MRCIEFLLVSILGAIWDHVGAIQCYSCKTSLFNPYACKDSRNIKTTQCYPGRGCYVAYNLLGVPTEMGCNDGSYPTDTWGWPQCSNERCNHLFSTVCTCQDKDCNSADLVKSVKYTQNKLECDSCDSAEACAKKKLKKVKCDEKDGCGTIYAIDSPAANNGTTIFRGCGGGMPKNSGFASLCFQYSTSMLCSCSSSGCNDEEYYNPLCDQGWLYNNDTNKCYYASPQIENSYADAKNYCLSHDANLASIHSLEESNFIATTLINASGNNTTPGFYIGLRWESDSNQTWVWEDGTDFDFTHWLPGQPDRKTAPANITRLIGVPANAVGFWDDINDVATNSKRVICKKDSYGQSVE